MKSHSSTILSVPTVTKVDEEVADFFLRLSQQLGWLQRSKA